MAIVFEYAHEFKDTSIEKALNKILAWLGKEGAQKVRSTGPTSIEAMHGTFKTFKPYEREGKKKLAFTLTSSGRDVTVNAVVKPSMAILDDIAPRVEETRANWGDLIEELWTSIDGTASSEVKVKKAQDKKVYDFEEEERKHAARRRSGKMLALLGAVDVATFSIIAVVLYYLEVDVPLILFSLPIVAAFCLMIWGLFRMRGPSTRTI